jgi:hypothetical protein
MKVLAYSLLGLSLLLSLQSAPANPQSNYSFAAAGQPVTIPFRMWDKEPLLRLQVGDRPPLAFAFDSGSVATYLDLNVAKRMGLTITGSGTVTGAGTGKVPVQYIENVTLKAPGLQSFEHRLTVTDLSNLTSDDGTHIDGILGSDFIRRFVVTLDYQDLRITIADPSSFEFTGAGAVLPVVFHGGWPYVPARVAVPGYEGEQAEFLFDTGSSDAVDDPAILRTNGPTRKIRTGVGLGSAAGQGVIGRGLYFQLGDYRLKGPIVACCSPHKEHLRMIGGEVLRRFTVIFDYTRQRIIVVPNRHFDEPFPDA